MRGETSISIEGVSKRYQLGSVARLNLPAAVSRWLGRRPAEPAGRLDVQLDEREFWALRDVSMTIGAGESVAFIGANGAGKSTMLKILSRITPPTRGRVEINGRVGTMLEVGTGFHPELTGRDNIFLNGAILGMNRREIEAKFDAIVEFSGVGRFLDTPVKRYSSGMYVRLAFAVASHLEPDVLIVDEVLAVGDAAFQRKCIERMKAIARTGDVTVLFVSHSLANVKLLCGRCVWFDSGQVRMDGGTEAVTDAYLQAQGVWKVEAPIRERTDRKGDGRWRAEHAEMRYDEPAGRWIFQLDYAAEAAEVEEPALVVGIHRSGVPGDCATALDSRCMGGLPERIPGRGRIHVLLPRDAAFAPGEYFCDLTCMAGNGVVGNYAFCDQLKAAFSFKVGPAAVFGWNRLPLTSAVMHLRQDWTVEARP